MFCVDCLEFFSKKIFLKGVTLRYYGYIIFLFHAWSRELMQLLNEQQQERRSSQSSQIKGHTLSTSNCVRRSGTQAKFWPVTLQSWFPCVRLCS